MTEHDPSLDLVSLQICFIFEGLTRSSGLLIVTGKGLCLA